MKSPCYACGHKRNCLIREKTPYLVMPGCPYHIPQLKAHRKILSEAVGRLLDKNEFVHHINGIHSDNRLDNLFLCSPSEHVRIHRLMRKGCGKFGAIEAIIKSRETASRRHYAKARKRNYALNNGSLRNSS